jgi:hypothetical protein
MSADRPLAAAAEQAAAALAAAEQRGAERERAKIAAEEVYELLSEGLAIVEDLSTYHEVWAQRVRVVLGCD